MTARAERLLDTVSGLEPLADLPRTGWLLRGIRPCESIAEHTLGVALVAMLLVDALREDGTTVDGERVLRIALIHDAPEARTGDVPMPVKSPELDAALSHAEETLVAQLLPQTQQALWHELEEGTSLEARVVKAADKLQMMARAYSYEKRGHRTLEDFWAQPKNFDDRGIAPAREAFDALCARAKRVRPTSA